MDTFSLDSPNSAPIACIVGTAILDEHVEMNPVTETVMITVHCFRLVQLFGLAAEVGNAPCIRDRVAHSAASPFSAIVNHCALTL
jgi:hypothetical protein